jgi:hypothetical protein
MTRNEIMKIAHKAGLHIATDVNWMPIIGLEYAEKFANQIAEHTLFNIDPSKLMSYQEGMEAGRLAEREACAKVCEAMNWYMDDGEECAAAIRARGQA